MTALPPRRRGSALLRATASLAALAGLLLAGGCGALQKLGGEPPPEEEPAPAPPLHPAVELTVQAPAELKQLLEKHLDLARLQQVDIAQAPNPGEWSRLIRSASGQARLMLQTEGYFEAKVTVRRDDTPADRPDAMRRLTVLVEPGPRVQVQGLQVETEGELSRSKAAGDATAIALARALPHAGPLKPGEAFRNEDWAQTKRNVVNQVRSAGYLAASLSSSHAEIDPDGQSAALRLVVDSGPLFVAGALAIGGLAKQDEVTARNLAGLPPGTVLTEQALLDYQERLQKIRLYQSASVTVDPDPAQAAAATVRVRLAEMPLQQATVGVGYSDSTGFRTTLEHTHRRPFDWPLVAYNKFELGTTSQTWTADVQSHPGPRFYRNVLGIEFDHVKGDTDVVQSQSIRLGRTQDTKRLERLYFAELLRSHQTPQLGNTTTAIALSANYNVVLRRLDNILLPTRGYTLALETGVGQATSHDGDSGPFTRLYARLTAYQPLGGDWYGQARIEAGEVLKPAAVEVPDKLGFRAGGDDSVRGYAYRSLSPVDAGGSQFSGMALATASVELARPILKRLPSVWGAVFIDAGNAAQDFKDFKAVIGYGVGVRWRSPVGPLRADLAWADALGAFRVHVSLGIQL